MPIDHWDAVNNDPLHQATVSMSVLPRALHRYSLNVGGVSVPSCSPVSVLRQYGVRWAHFPSQQGPYHQACLVVGSIHNQWERWGRRQHMTTTFLATKLQSPSLRPLLVDRPRLIERLNQGLHRRLTLVSAPAGYGKTTLVGAWLDGCERPTAWLSLEAGDRDPARFLGYLIAALQQLSATIGAGVARLLDSPEPAPIEVILTSLLNDLFAFPDQFILVLDDYHLLDTRPIDRILTYLIEHMPPQMHLVICTREDPHLPLARLRARDHVTELRAADLRCTPAETAGFLTRVMSLALSTSDITALERRTEGWIAGLQLAGLSLRGSTDPSGFIRSFTGSNQMVMDYLVDEILHRQSEEVQSFLLRTCILERLSGPLCEAVLGTPAGSGEAMLDYIDQANLFLIPLDHGRQWFRYHHLFAEMLRRRLCQSLAASPTEAEEQVSALHLRASRWYEEQGLLMEAFHHATAAADIDYAFHLIQGRGIPLHATGAVTAMLDWMNSLAPAVLEAHPALLVRFASLILVKGQTTGVEEKLYTAEVLLREAEPEERTRDLLGQIATARATLATNQYQVDAMLLQSRRALEYLRPANLVFRATALWTQGLAYFLQGDRAAARQAYSDAFALSQAAQNAFFTLLATIGLGQVQEASIELYPAAETYRKALKLAGDQPLPVVSEAHLGLARIYYQWNELDAAERHARTSLLLARQYESAVDRLIPTEIFLGELKLAVGDMAGASALIADAGKQARRWHLEHHLAKVAAAQVRMLLAQGQLEAAVHLVGTYADLPLSQARVQLAGGNPSAALETLARRQRQVEARGWQDERLAVLVLQALALRAQGDPKLAVRRLQVALQVAEPGGFLRLFADEGAAMAELLCAAGAAGIMPDYIDRVLAVSQEGAPPREAAAPPPAYQPLIEPLSRREREVLQLIAVGLSNQEIAERLVLALETVKGHNKRIFGKLQVQRRTEAVARARDLGLL